MKIILFGLILLTFTSLETKAQNCQVPCPYYNIFVKKAQADTIKNTQIKLNYYRAAIVAAKDCDCPELEQLANSKIDTLFILIEDEKRKAELQAKTISQQQAEIEKTLAETEAANETNIKIINAIGFYDGKFGLALKNGKYGFIDKEGNTKIDFDYDKGRPFSLSDGFASMEIIDKFSNKGVEYLIDTIGNRYQSFSITEEYIALLKKKLAKNKSRSKLEGEESLKNISELLAYEINKTEGKIALDFYGVKKTNILNILQYLAKDNKIHDRVEVLILSDDHLYKFPSFIMEFKNVKHLDISDAGIKSIPKTIDKLINLKILKFPYLIKKLSSSVYNLENLEVMDFFNTEVTMKKLPKTIDNLTSLKILVAPCNLVIFPENISNLENLEVLDLSYTEIEEIPESIGKLKKLKKLKTPIKLKKIPSNIYDLENLEFLELYATDQREIPESIGNLKNLKKLDIDTPFEKVPSSISRLEKLESLSLASKSIEGIMKLPDSIGNLKELEELYIFFPLKVLPESICKLQNLEVLYLPPSLESFPKDFGNLINLKELVIEDNQNLKNIPDLSKMKKLEYFFFTLYKDQNYTTNLEKLKELQKKLPDCNFTITTEEEKK